MPAFGQHQSFSSLLLELLLPGEKTAGRAARSEHSTLCEAENFQTVWAEIHNVLTHNEPVPFVFEYTSVRSLLQ